jgi:hypothetical protein
MLCVVLVVALVFGTSSMHLCTNCKNHLPGDKCRAFPKTLDAEITMFRKRDEMLKSKQYVAVATAAPDTNDEYFYCSTARNLESMCGMFGQMFISKNQTQT